MEVRERTGSSGRFKGGKIWKKKKGAAAKKKKGGGEEKRVFLGQRRGNAGSSVFFFWGRGAEKKGEQREQLKNKNLRSRWQRPPVILGKSFSFFCKFSKLSNSMSSFVGFDC